MLVRLSGKLIEKEPTRVVVESMGVGLECKVSLKTSEQLTEIGSNVLLHTLFIFSGNASLGPLTPVLFGFFDKVEKTMFELLLSVNRLGASKVMAVLSTLTPEEIAHSIINNDIKRLSSVKGIGLKQGERIVLDLREKIMQGSWGNVESNTKTNPSFQLANDAVFALEALGYTRVNAEKQIKNIMARQTSPLTVEELVREALMES